MTGDIVGGATWITATYDTATGARRWLVTAAEGTALGDVVVDATRVYVTGQGATGAGTPALAYWLTVVAYDRATGARLWRMDRKAADATEAAGLRIDLAPDGSLVVAGPGRAVVHRLVHRGARDHGRGSVGSRARRRTEHERGPGRRAGAGRRHDGRDGRRRPEPSGRVHPGRHRGLRPDGTLLWEAFARMATVWAAALPSGDVCATGGYDALVTCWRVSPRGGNRPPAAVISATPVTGFAPLTVSFDGSASADPDGTVKSWAWSFGDGSFATGALATHVYSSPGTYAASLTVTDDGGASSTATRLIVVAAALPPAAPTNLTATALPRKLDPPDVDELERPTRPRYESSDARDHAAPTSSRCPPCRGRQRPSPTPGWQR